MTGRRGAGPGARLALRRLSEDQRRLLRDLARAGREGDLFVVGGTVRDLLLGRRPAELDLAVAGPGDALALPTPGLRRHVHEEYGTVSLWRADHRVADLASTRIETYPTPGARPVVRRGSLRADLDRRDFTVNAMAAPLSHAGNGAFLGVGSIVDPRGGRRDLRRGVLRILHAGSFRDDPTRALRAARLASRFGFRLSPGTARALDQACGAGAFAEVGPGRWEAEISRLLREDRPALALRRAMAWGIWDALEGEPVSGPALRRAALLAADSEPAAPSRRLGLMLAALALEARPESARARLSRVASSGLVQSALDLATEARSPRPGPRARRLASLARAAGVL